jgi:hypothetical protein
MPSESLEAKYGEALTAERMQTIETYFVKEKSIPKERFDIKLSEDEKAPVSLVKFDLKI